MARLALECARMRTLRALTPTCRARLALTDAAFRRKWKVQSPEQVGAVVSPAPCPGPSCTAFSGAAAIFCSVVPCCGPHVDDAKGLQGSGPALPCRQHPRVIADPVCTTCSREGAPGVQLGHAYCLSCKSRCFQFLQSDRSRVRRRALACHLRRQLCATHGSGLRRLEQSGKVESVVLVMVLGSVTSGRLGRWDVDGVLIQGADAEEHRLAAASTNVLSACGAAQRFAVHQCILKLWVVDRDCGCPHTGTRAPCARALLLLSRSSRGVP